ncbi:hypothetical protein C8R45DRAFT_1209713 [Mycena sanguinolenta]|nr:hypothetical protein C8R45DRAFT_1209713 [Mycena sanguinolenta]
MASEDGPKKQRSKGACDICRRQKIRCDRASMPNQRCSNCVAFNSECITYTSQVMEKGPRRKRTNVQPGTSSIDSPRMETARSVVDGLLRQTYTAPQDSEALLQLLLDVSRYARSLEQELDKSRHAQSSQPSTAFLPAPDVAGVIADIQNLPEHLTILADDRISAKNSSIMFVKTAMNWARLQSTPNVCAPRFTRPMYWTALPWEICPEPAVTQTFPPPDLLRNLVDIYFDQINIFSFILHRPTFEQSLADGLHLRNSDFGATVLAVCALGGRNSSDKRVILPSEQGELGAGWEWFRQIRRPFSGPAIKNASLYEVQLCCLYLLFQQTGSDPGSTWSLCGMGILQARDVGTHLLVADGTSFTIEAESLRRCCFHLSIFNSISNACFGRPRVDVPGEYESPTACDDEYWEHPDPTMNFKQPAGKPALSEFFTAYIALMKIFTFSWWTSANYTGMRPLEPETVAELDARLNQWATEIPEHLLWNPYQQNSVFFEQSVVLYASYYHVQILAHRPFLQAKSVSTLRSVSICTSAARSYATIADVKVRRGGILPNYYLVKVAFDSAILLLLNISGGTRSGLVLDIDREIADVHKCMRLLRQTEARFQNAGRFYDCICEILNASNLPLPATSSSDPLSSNPSLGTPNDRDAPWEMNNGQAAESWPESFLPMAVEDLGSLPIYESFDFSDLERHAAAASNFEPLPSYDFTGVPPLGANMDTDHYLSHWMPYFSTVDEVVQAMLTDGVGASSEM